MPRSNQAPEERAPCSGQLTVDTVRPKRSDRVDVSGRIDPSKEPTELDTTFLESAPGNFVVLDDLLDTVALESLRSTLQQHWGWRYKNWVNRYLHNYDFDYELLEPFLANLEGACPALLTGMELQKAWAIMMHKNVGVGPHADAGAIAVNLWLTPDEHNADPDTGGLTFFDVKREEGAPYHKYNDPVSAATYIGERTLGATFRVPYRYGRAVVFDAATFHASETVEFASVPRINVSMIFDTDRLYPTRAWEG